METPCFLEQSWNRRALNSEMKNQKTTALLPNICLACALFLPIFLWSGNFGEEKHSMVDMLQGGGAMSKPLMSLRIRGPHRNPLELFRMSSGLKTHAEASGFLPDAYWHPSGQSARISGVWGAVWPLQDQILTSFWPETP